MLAENSPTRAPSRLPHSPNVADAIVLFPSFVPSSDAFTLSPLHAGERTSRSAQEQPPVMPGHSRSKNGVASPRLCPGQDERGKAESRNGRSRHGRTRTSLLSTVRARNSAHSRENRN